MILANNTSKKYKLIGVANISANQKIKRQGKCIALSQRLNQQTDLLLHGAQVLQERDVAS